MKHNMMSNEQLRAQMDEEAEAAAAVPFDEDNGQPLPPHVKVSRPNRARGKVLQIRLSDAELAELEAIAERRGQQVSAFARDELLAVAARDQVKPQEVVNLVGSLMLMTDRLRQIVGAPSLAEVEARIPKVSPF